MDTVHGEHLKLGVADKCKLEASHALFPFTVGRITADFLDDIFDRDVAPRASLPREEDVDGMHVLIFLYNIGHMTLAAHEAAHLLMR